MANPDHLATLGQGVESWNKWIAKRRGKGDYSGADLAGADFSGKDLTGIDLKKANLAGATLAKARLDWACLEEADMSDSVVSGAHLNHANFKNANLDRADLRHVLAISANFYGALLRNARMSESCLHGTSMEGSRMTSIDLSGSDLGEKEMPGEMAAMDLGGPDDAAASLAYAYLDDADLTSTRLIGTNFTYARLDRTDFSGATLDSTLFTDVDLRNARGLDAVIHRGPSTVGIDTIYRSQGKISHQFLRGAGVPEVFIEYMTSLVGAGIEFYSVFISFSESDKDFATRLQRDLQDRRVRCWFAPKSVRGGKKLHDQISEAIQMHDRLLLVLSPSSMKSEWVKTEIARARELEVQEGRRILFPISLCPFKEVREWECFDSDVGKDSAREIREYFIPDFSDWQDPQKYQEMLTGLVRDLAVARKHHDTGTAPNIPAR